MNSKEILMMSKMAGMSEEEREFADNYWATKTLTFCPPPFEEFLKTGEWYDTAGKYMWIDIRECSAEQSAIFHIASHRISAEYDDWGEDFEYDPNNIESKKQAYYDAVEYLKKSFLGEE